MDDSDHKLHIYLLTRYADMFNKVMNYKKIGLNNAPVYQGLLTL